MLEIKYNYISKKIWDIFYSCDYGKRLSVIKAFPQILSFDLQIVTKAIRLLQEKGFEQVLSNCR